MQAISNDDIILQPHGPKSSVVASRGDSAADAFLDKEIAPVLKQQPVGESTLEP